MPEWLHVQEDTVVSDFVPPPDDVSAVSATLECAICLEPFVRGEHVRTLPCMHRFHMQCADRWLRGDMPKSFHCPVCRTKVVTQRYDLRYCRHLREHRA